MLKKLVLEKKLTEAVHPEEEEVLTGNKEVVSILGNFAKLPYQQKIQAIRQKLMKLGRTVPSSLSRKASLKYRDLLLDLVWLFIDGLDTASELNVLRNPARFRRFATEKWEEFVNFLDEMAKEQGKRL